MPDHSASSSLADCGLCKVKEKSTISKSLRVKLLDVFYQLIISSSLYTVTVTPALSNRKWVTNQYQLYVHMGNLSFLTCSQEVVCKTQPLQRALSTDFPYRFQILVLVGHSLLSETDILFTSIQIPVITAQTMVHQWYIPWIQL